MPFFQYRARNREGALVTGELEAEDLISIEAALDRMGLIPIKISPFRKVEAFKGMDFRKAFERKPRPSDLIPFSRQLATLFNAGVPLVKALNTLQLQAASPSFANTVKAVREDVEGGMPFFRSLQKHPKVFTELYSAMVAAGEAGGILDDVLNRLALMMEKNAENAAKVKSATLYPKIVVGAIVVAVVILMSFVVPKFSKLYSQFKVDLPLPTKVLIAISNAFLNYWPLILLAAVSGFIGLKLFLNAEAGKAAWDRFVLKVPVFGLIIRKSILSRFSRILGSLYKSGMPILQALDISSRAIENRTISGGVQKVQEQVRSGRMLSETLSEDKNFPPMMIQMIAVGEETGNLDIMLEKVSEYYDQEVDSAIKNLTTLLEPILLVFIFGMVLFLALAIFLPMWDMIKFVKR